MSIPSPKEFYETYKDNPEEAKRSAFETGKEFGNFLLSRLDESKDDLDTVAAILNEFQIAVQGEPTAKVENDKVIMRCSGFCPITRAAMTLNLSWEWLDENLGWPLVHGIASTIILGIKLTIPSTKSRGDTACIYILEK